MASTKKLVPILIMFLASIILIIPTIISNEITCTSTNHCRDDPIQCIPNEPCTVNCFGSNLDNDACTYTELHCANDYPCTVNCNGAEACWGIQIYCANNTECNVITAYGHRSMAWAEIYGGYNGVLNVRNDANSGLELASIICPINGECNIYSKKLLNATSSVSEMYMDVTLNATSSNTLTIDIEGYHHPLRFSMIYCPMDSTITRPNCMIRVSDGGDINIGDLLYGTEIYTNEYTDLYIDVDAIRCTKCTIELQLHCADYQDTCDAILVNGTNDEWQCVNTSKPTHCPTTAIPTTDIATTANIIDAWIVLTTDTPSRTRTLSLLIDKYLLYVVGFAVGFAVFIVIVCIIYCVSVCKNKKGIPRADVNVIAVIPEAHGVVMVREEGETTSRTNTIDTLGNTLTTYPNVFDAELVQINTKNTNILLEQRKYDDGGVKCVKCVRVITNGKIYIEKGLFYCSECHMTYMPDTLSECDSLFGTHPDEILTKGKSSNVTPGNEMCKQEFGKCVECGYIEFGTIGKDGLYCNRCWNSYLLKAIEGPSPKGNAKAIKEKIIRKNKYGKCVDCGYRKMGRIYEQDRSFYCDECWKNYVDSDDIGKEEPHKQKKHQHKGWNKLKENKPQMQWGKCIECESMKKGKKDEDGSFFCNDCWENYLENNNHEDSNITEFNTSSYIE